MESAGQIKRGKKNIKNNFEIGHIQNANAYFEKMEPFYRLISKIAKADAIRA